MRVPAMTNVPATTDVTQEGYGDALEVPEIRVWLHPHWVEKEGPDHYQVFDSFKDALAFIEERKPECEDTPLIAFRGYELNIWDMEPVLDKATEGK